MDESFSRCSIIKKVVDATRCELAGEADPLAASHAEWTDAHLSADIGFSADADFLRRARVSGQGCRPIHMAAQHVEEFHVGGNFVASANAAVAPAILVEECGGDVGAHVEKIGRFAHQNIREREATSVFKID